MCAGCLPIHVRTNKNVCYEAVSACDEQKVNIFPFEIFCERTHVFHMVADNKA
ncbi:hypothetical protein SAMN06295960_2745 [Paenibacillus aquistagni]|uniref:Uncharacterized protein n=1 Tax=Paenibacillus aquistagni TaxID=1852522 RepID=A0A1X7KV33_9BACL|nr:hypothetical protein SAMN06295960_2745 [Paenibacillus aquistagni]